MDYQVAWTEAAREDYRSIASHLLDHYDFKVADRFTDSVADKVRLLEKIPFIGRRLEKLSSVRRFPIEPYTMMYYVVIEKKIVILNLLDARQSIL